MNEIKITGKTIHEKVVFAPLQVRFPGACYGSRRAIRHTTALNLVFSSPIRCVRCNLQFHGRYLQRFVTHPNLVKFRGMSPDRVQCARPSLFRINTRRAQAGFRVLRAMAAGAGVPSKALCAGHWTAQRN